MAAAWSVSNSTNVRSCFVRVVAVVLIYFVLLSAENVTKQQQCVCVCSVETHYAVVTYF